MTHKHCHDDCKHESMKYCAKCEVPYCADCGREWKQYQYPYWNPWYQYPYTAYPYGTWTVGNDPAWNSGTVANVANSANSGVAVISCVHN